ncbi:MAG: 50S ribosomal protein L24 [Eubacterium sp.]|nr:50S ribosomal protein L24 [Eubacterium sp.]
MAVKIKKGDTVKVIAGKDKDKQGKVLVVEPKKNRVVVEGINMVSKHTKANQQNTNGGIIEKEAPIDISNVMYLHKGKATRIGYKFVNGKKVRVAKSTGDVLD